MLHSDAFRDGAAVRPVLAPTFSTEEETVRIANATHAGLEAGMWTRDLARARQVALQAIRVARGKCDKALDACTATQTAIARPG